MNVSRETTARLETYAALLTKWNPAINLVAKSTLPDLWTRHIADSAQLFDLCPPDARTWVDLGSGGGFPGMVVAILAIEAKSDLQVTLVESDQRKATFLRTVARETGAPVTIHSQRAESLPPQGADVLSARAFAPLPRLLAHVHHHLAPGGVAFLPKGAQADAEIAEALASWGFQVQKTPSKTDPQAVILSIKGLTRAA